MNNQHANKRNIKVNMQLTRKKKDFEAAAANFANVGNNTSTQYAQRRAIQ